MPPNHPGSFIIHIRRDYDLRLWILLGERQDFGDCKRFVNRVALNREFVCQWAGHSTAEKDDGSCHYGRLSTLRAKIVDISRGRTTVNVNRFVRGCRWRVTCAWPVLICETRFLACGLRAFLRFDIIAPMQGIWERILWDICAVPKDEINRWAGSRRRSLWLRPIVSCSFLVQHHRAPSAADHHRAAIFQAR